MSQNVTSDQSPRAPVTDDRSDSSADQLSSYLAVMAVVVALIIAWAGFCTF